MASDYSFFDRSFESLAVASFDAELLDAVIDHWHQCLMEAPERDVVLKGLGVKHALAEALRIGLSDRSLGLRIPGRRWKAGLAMRTRLSEFGILRDTGHEAFRGCVVVPIVNERGVVALYGHRLERGREDVWASGLPGSMFEVRSGGVTDDAERRPAAPRSRAIVTSSMLDALAVLGALDTSRENDVEASSAGSAASSLTVVAPGRPRGYGAKDLRDLGARYDDVTLLGRDAVTLADKLRQRGSAVALAGEECDVARTITSSDAPARVVAAMLDGATSVPRDVDDTDGGEVPVGATTTSTPGRDEVFVAFATRSWRIRGARARANVDGDRLGVALSVSDTMSGRFHLDTLDLYLARQRAAFLDAAASELVTDRDGLTGEMAAVLNCAERSRDDVRAAPELAPMTEDDRRAALAWLEGPQLLERLAVDLVRTGVVGEATNLLVCYLATVSRKCERPLGVLVQSSSAGGKSTILDAVCSLVPAEDLLSLSAITSQALYYLGGSGLRHKVLSVAEEHGSSRASYALKLLLSEGRLAIASTGKDRASGRLTTTSYETNGPPALLMTTTATSIDPELENRLVVLGVNEEHAQTAAILDAQRRGASVDGLRARSDLEELRRRHANVQRLLMPIPVVIPAFDANFPSSATRHRRDHAKLLSIIAAITLLHQYQREHRTAQVAGETITYLEATGEDVEFGLALARQVLVRSNESLAPQTSRLLEVVREHCVELAATDDRAPTEVEVTRRELRELLGWSDTQVRVATDRLVALEYLVVAGGGRGRCRTYRLVPEFATSRQGSPTSPTVPSRSGVRAVRATGVRTPSLSSSGENDRFVGFVSSSNVATGAQTQSASYGQAASGAPS
jgi:hypothetical protein